MPSRVKINRRNQKGKPARYSVTVPAPLVVHLRRLARQRNLTISHALVELAERGIQAELDAKDELASSYERFLREQDPAHKSRAGKNLVRTIFGKDSIAEDSLL
jgi:hypothetical protein